MEIVKKARVAHRAKFDPKNYTKRSKGTEDRKIKEPKVIASGCVTQQPIVLVRSSSDDGDTSDSRENLFKRIQLGLRPRCETRYEESYIQFKALKDGLDTQKDLTRKNMANNKVKKRPKLSVSPEEPEPEESLKEHDRANPYPQTYVRPCKNTVDWDFYIKNPDNLRNVPPVEYFSHAPLVEIWKDIAKVGISFELRNPFVEGSQDVFWLGTAVYFCGYKALVKFESFREADSDDSDSRNPLTWISFCSNVPRHLGWCKENGYELQPGPLVDESMTKEELAQHIEEFMKRDTVSRDHEEKLYHAIRDKRKFNPATPVEVMHKVHLTENRLGRITTISGNRVHVAYYSDQRIGEKRKRDGSHGCWYHFAAESIHPLGWSHTVGVELKGIPERTVLPILPSNQFPQYPKDLVKIRPGMFLETRHPIRLKKIVGAEIIKTYREGHFMIETREACKPSRARFIYHVTSPFVLPIGFGERNGLEVDTTIPKETAIKKRLRLDLLPKKPSHKFQKGFKVEAIGILDPFYLTPCTVLKVAEHLLLLHADGFSKDYELNYHWVDVETSDIYPCGYREMMGTEWHGFLDEQPVL